MVIGHECSELSFGVLANAGNVCQIILEGVYVQLRFLAFTLSEMGITGGF